MDERKMEELLEKAKRMQEEDPEEFARQVEKAKEELGGRKASKIGWIAWIRIKGKIDGPISPSTVHEIYNTRGKGKTHSGDERPVKP